MSRLTVVSDRGSFTSESFRLAAGLLIWAVHLAVIYAAAGLVCARPSLQLDVAGVELLDWLIGGATLLAVAALAAVMLSSATQGLSARQDSAVAVFFNWIVLAVAVLSLVAVIWQALPALIVPACA